MSRKTKFKTLRWIKEGVEYFQPLQKVGSIFDLL